MTLSGVMTTDDRYLCCSRASCGANGIETELRDILLLNREFVINQRFKKICFYVAINVNFSLSFLFTALHGMQTRSCDENSVGPSVRKTREL